MAVLVAAALHPEGVPCGIVAGTQAGVRGALLRQPRGPAATDSTRADKLPTNRRELDGGAALVHIIKNETNRYSHIDTFLVALVVVVCERLPHHHGRVLRRAQLAARPPVARRARAPAGRPAGVDRRGLVAIRGLGR